MGGLLDRVSARRSAPSQRWPVGRGDIRVFDSEYGHRDDRFTDEKWEEYLVRSNEIFSAAMLRARLMASLEIRLYDRQRGPRKEVTEGPVLDLLDHVNPHWTAPRLAMMDELSMCIWGETAWAVEKGAFGDPREIWWLKPSKLLPVPDADEYLKGYLYEAMNGDVIPFDADEVVWFRYPNPIEEFSALSPLSAGRLAADTANDMTKANRNLFQQGLLAGGLVTPDSGKVVFSEEQAKDLERDLDRRMRGVDKAHRWAVLRYEASFKGLNVTPKDAEYPNGLNLALRQIGNANGMPVTLLNDFANATLTNAREHKLLAWEHALVPDSKLRAAEMAEQFLPMFGRSAPKWAEYDYTKVPALQAAQTEIWSRDRQMIEAGGLTINEWRKDRGLDPVPWGDVWWGPLNKGPVTDEEPPTAPSKPEESGTSSNGLLAPFDTMISSLADQYPHRRTALNGHRR